MHSIDSLQSIITENFEVSLSEFISATPLTKPDKRSRLTSQLDVLLSKQGGVQVVYRNIVALIEGGYLQDTSWQDPKKLVVSLINGTIKAGHPGSTIEAISELRILAIWQQKLKYVHFSKEDAGEFLEEALALNLEYALQEPMEESRVSMSDTELQKSYNVFGFIWKSIDHNRIKHKLFREIQLTVAQKPIVTRKARSLIQMVYNQVNLELDDEITHNLRTFTDAIYEPTDLLKQKSGLNAYRQLLPTITGKQLEKECIQIADKMYATGLVSNYHAILLEFLLQNERVELIPCALALNESGEAEYDKHTKLINELISDLAHPYNAQWIYGLNQMLEKGLFSREAVANGLNNLRRIKVHSIIESRIYKSIIEVQPEISARDYLLSATIRTLGQPLGVGQGNNPTCQSARGISMWSRHSPAKLIDMIITVATQNNLDYRFEGQLLESSRLAPGLLDKLDYSLDAVSITLVPHLDKLYNEMMRLAANRGEDPHKWVNPAMYGQWIQVGFASAYDPVTNSICDFDGFLRIFYAAFHPSYNGGNRMVYPNPVGIFITSANGDMVGYHAVSLLRIDKYEDEYRAYFLNPNNEGRQNWGQEIKPTVHGYGERAGESSLPFYQFAARLYAFHYSRYEVATYIHKVGDQEINKVIDFAKTSWGKSYHWTEFKKQW